MILVSILQSNRGCNIGGWQNVGTEKIGANEALGVGKVTASTLMANLPELGEFDKYQIMALVCTAPFHRDTGFKKRKRSIQGGRPDVRESLYMATLCATRHNVIIKTFYQRLFAAGNNQSFD